jgi:Tfp pilus assembly protein PilV
MSSISMQTGDSLIEVMIALTLTAITALCIVAMQSVLARGEREALLRERAAWIADSAVEALRGDADSEATLSQWRTRTSTMLPDGNLAVSERADGVRVATVSWHADDRSDPCPEPQAKAFSSCIVVAFAR